MHPALMFALVSLNPVVLVVVFAAAVFGMMKIKTLIALLASLAGYALLGTTVSYPGFGSHLASGGTAGSSYTNVAQLKNADFDGLKVDFDEITNFDSPTGGAGLAVFKEYIKTVVDGGSCTFDGVLNPADPTSEALFTNLQLNGQTALYFWKLTLTDGSILVFQGYVESFKMKVQYNKAITFSGGIKIVGPITATWS